MQSKYKYAADTTSIRCRSASQTVAGKEVHMTDHLGYLVGLHHTRRKGRDLGGFHQYFRSFLSLC